MGKHRILNYYRGSNFHISLHLMDFKNIFKVRGINFRFAKNHAFRNKYVNGWWLSYWTPTWHEGRGPYVTIGLGVVEIMRGY
jgi:hypothetical protein